MKNQLQIGAESIIGAKKQERNRNKMKQQERGPMEEKKEGKLRKWNKETRRKEKPGEKPKKGAPERNQTKKKHSRHKPASNECLGPLLWSWHVHATKGTWPGPGKPVRQVPVLGSGQPGCF